MNADLVRYINDVCDLQKQFSINSGICEDAEIKKIWSRWIITHRSLLRQGNLILPDDESYDPQLILELQNKSCKSAAELHSWLLSQSRTINNRFEVTATMEAGGLHLIPRDIPLTERLVSNLDIKVSDTGLIVALQCESLYVDMHASAYDRLLRLYSSADIGLVEYRDHYIWLCSYMYSLLDGKGLQWATPPKVMSALRTHFSCFTELFASPLNAYNDKYYSLFAIDRMFGSKGNFFTAPDSDFIEGSYQVNPPFIESLFNRTTEKIIHLLDNADKMGRILTFIYIMPEWTDFYTYDMIAGSRFCVKTIRLLSGQHYYFEYSSLSYIRARFNTVVTVLSTDLNCCTSLAEDSIRTSFTYA